MVEQKAKTAAGKKTVATAKSKTTAAAPAVKKAAKAAAPTAKKTTEAAAPAVKKAAPRKAAAPKSKKVAKPSPEERYRMVEMAAYFIAERHGFQGNSIEHWGEAERQISVMLGE